MLGRFGEVRTAWTTLQGKSEERRAMLDAGFDEQKYVADLGLYEAWCGGMEAQIAKEELGTDVAGAQAVLLVTRSARAPACNHHVATM